MRVCYRAFRGRVTVYEQAEVRFCCREMQDEWDILVGFGVKRHLRTTSREVNIFTSHHLLTSGNLVQGVTEIKYCPWCGEEIEIVRMKEKSG